MNMTTEMLNLKLVLVCFFLNLVPFISAHVALTYPPARGYDLDFLDNSRTKGPCGMPKGEFSFSFAKFFVVENRKTKPKGI